MRKLRQIRSTSNAKEHGERKTKKGLGLGATNNFTFDKPLRSPQEFGNS